VLRRRRGNWTVRYSKHYTCDVAEQEWEVRLVDEVLDWMDTLEPSELKRVVDAINALEENGPGLGRPTVDTISNSTIANLKERADEEETNV
jgi:hypothetical protein